MRISIDTTIALYYIAKQSLTFSSLLSKRHIYKTIVVKNFLPFRWIVLSTYAEMKVSVT